MTERSDRGQIPTIILHCLADGACRTMDELDELLDLNRRQISDGAARLVMRDYVERIEVGCYQLTVSGLEAAKAGTTIKCGPIGPHTGRTKKPGGDTFRRRLWNAMRVGGAFTIPDLIMAARRDDAAPESNAASYIRHLVAAGYLVELRQRQRGSHLTSNGFKRFRLILNTGPIAPVWSNKRRTLHDYNTGEDVPCQSK